MDTGRMWEVMRYDKGTSRFQTPYGLFLHFLFVSGQDRLVIRWELRNMAISELEKGSNFDPSFEPQHKP